MCKHCDQEDLLEVEWIQHGEEEVDCEWIEDDEDDDGASPEAADEDDDDAFEVDLAICAKPARLLVVMRVVDAHLCPEHHEALLEQLGEGLADMLAAAGLQDDVEFLPLAADAEETCSECANAATLAQVVTYHQYYCEKHAQEAGATLPPRS